jgi:hypothetical protein
MRRLVAALSNLSGNHRREIASACESGPEMTAFGPIVDGFDEVAGGRLLTFSDLPN